MTLNALIVDDEEYSRKSLYFLLQEHCHEVQIGGIAKSASEARALADSQHFDLVFLDIAMPRESGFDILPELQSKNIVVIFTTAYDQYALKALKARAIDYLLKPIDIEELKAAVKKAVEWKSFQNQQLKTSRNSAEEGSPIPPHSSDKAKLVLPNAHGFNVIDTNSIVFIEADSNYSVFHLNNNDKIVISKPLKEFEETLENKSFARIHKSVIVNFRYVRGYSHKNGFQVILTNDIVLPVSRRRANEFQEKARAFFKS